MLQRARTTEFRALAEKLVEVSEEFSRLQRQFPDLIIEGRAKRKGKPIRQSQWQKQSIEEADLAAVKASADLEASYSAISSEVQLIQTALQCEKFDYKTWAFIYESVHQDEQHLAVRIRSLQGTLISEMEAYLQSRCTLK